MSDKNVFWVHSSPLHPTPPKYHQPPVHKQQNFSLLYLSLYFAKTPHFKFYKGKSAKSTVSVDEFVLFFAGVTSLYMI